MSSPISIIIPARNAAEVLARNLAALQADLADGLEIIVVDDASTDATAEVAERMGARVLKHESQKGPAAARNFGARVASAPVLFFCDADVVLKADAVQKVRHLFDHRPDAVAMNGMYAKEPLDDLWMSQYMALWKYACWTPAPKVCTSFNACIGAVRKNVFTELGGFDESYRRADTEDYEFGYRLSQRHPILMEPELQGWHHFKGFFETLKNYFKRSGQWMELFKKRRRFDTGQAQMSVGISMICGTLAVLAGVLACFSCPYSQFVSLFFFLLYLALNRRFFGWVLRRGNPFFFVYCLLVHLALAFAVMAGVLDSFTFESQSVRTR